MRQPTKQVRLLVLQMRPLEHSISDVQPTLQVVVARSQYVSFGQGTGVGNRGTGTVNTDLIGSTRSAVFGRDDATIRSDRWVLDRRIGHRGSTSSSG
jgi:hypothetical protein